MEKVRVNNFRESLLRIKKLCKLQFSQKFTFLKTSTKKSLVYSVLFKVLGLVLGTVILNLLFKFFRDTAGLKMDEGILGFLIFVICATCFISAIGRAFKNLYDVKDNQFLLSMPVSASEIFISKIILTIMQEFFVCILLSLSLQLSFMIASGGMLYPIFKVGTFNFIFMFIQTTLILPIVISLFAILISVPVMLLVKFIKKHTWLVVVSLLSLMALGLYLFSIITNLAVENISLIGQWFTLTYKLQSALNGFVNKSWIFKIIVECYKSSACWWSLLVLISLLLIFGVMAYFLIKPFYYKISVTENIKQRKVKDNKKKNTNQISSSSSFWAITKKNILLLWGNPSHFLSFFAVVLLMPFIILLIDKFFNALYLRDLGYNLLFGSNLAMIEIFSLMGSTYAGTGVSQEGENFYLLKSSPISYFKQAYSKILINFVINFVLIFVSSFIACLTTSITWLQFILLVVCSSLINLAYLLFAYSHDFAHPNVSWKDRSEFQKSKNIGRTILFALVWGLIYGIFVIKFIYLAPISRAIVYMVAIPCIFLLIAIRTFYLRLKYHTAKV